jgi:hypothetical protein
MKKVSMLFAMLAMVFAITFTACRGGEQQPEGEATEQPAAPAEEAPAPAEEAPAPDAEQAPATEQ